MPNPRALILSDHEARAAAAGRLGLIVRPVKGVEPDWRPLVAADGSGDVKFVSTVEDEKHCIAMDRTPWLRSPFGPAGTVLYVKEAWKAFEPGVTKLGGGGPWGNMDCRIYANPPIEGESVFEFRADVEDPRRTSGWRSSTHLPLWAVRTRLVNRGVSVLRVQDLSQADCIALGAPAVSLHDLDCTSIPPSHYYSKAWNARYARRPGLSWDENPPVWRCEVERMET